MTRTRTLAAALLIVLSVDGLGAAPDGYIHNIYFTTRRPDMSRKGRWTFDVSTRERMEDFIGELAGLGINAMTYHSAYRIDGADYTPKHPELQRAPRWPAEDKPVEWFLDICAKHGIAGSLAVFIYPTYDHRKAVLATQDMVKLFRGRPGMAGYVPPIEAGPSRGHDPNRFVDVCRWVKTAAPELTIMDYPNGPYSPSIVQVIVQRGASGVVDVENVQFHGADKRLKNFYVTRGMTHLVMGMASKCRSIVHTHYRYGGSKPWLYPEDAYKVRQQAVLTATPHGTSIFSFQHAMWGADSGPDEKEADPMWRRLEWYTGIMAVQRMAPIIFDAKPLADAAVVIPANTVAGGQDLVDQYWIPFVNARVCAQMISYANQLSATAQTVVCPSLVACDATQLEQLEALARAGRTLVLPSVGKPDYLKWDSDRTRRILGGAKPPRLDTTALSPEFLRLLGGVDKDGYLTPVAKTTALPLGKGQVVLLPMQKEAIAEQLPSIVKRRAAPVVQADGLPAGYMLELWQTRQGTRFATILATEPGLSAQGASITLPGREKPGAVWFIDRQSAELLPHSVTGRGLSASLPKLNDEYALLLLGPTPAPVLRPGQMLYEAKVGQPIEVACRVVNTTGKPASGVLRYSLPKGWPSMQEANAFNCRLAPGQTMACRFPVLVPTDAQRRPHFVQFKLGDQVQRCMIFPTDGKPQVVSHKPPPAYDPKAPRVKRKPRLLTSEWRGVTAGAIRDNDTRGNVPGVCFLPRSQEWDLPAEHKGKPARYAEVLPRLGGANLLLNNPDPAADAELRITYCAKKAGPVSAYDGKKYHEVCKLAAAADWTTTTFRVPKSLLANPNADRSTHPGTNIMFDVRVDGLWVHRIEARRAE